MSTIARYYFVIMSNRQHKRYTNYICHDDDGKPIAAIWFTITVSLKHIRIRSLRWILVCSLSFIVSLWMTRLKTAKWVILTVRYYPRSKFSNKLLALLSSSRNIYFSCSAALNVFLGLSSFFQCDLFRTSLCHVLLWELSLGNESVCL